MVNRAQKKLLSIDGGGILGIIALGALRKIESDLREHTGEPDFRLRDYFDYIGGTSTGAIIAAGLALGKSVDQIEQIYLNEAESIFDRQSTFRWIFGGLKRKFNHAKLSERLKEEFSELSIAALQDAGKLDTERHLLVVTRNVETDSPWPISTNPRARYNDRTRADCNLNIPLWQLVRASTAAPTFFAPERLQWDRQDPSKQFYFEDGAVTPYNNPAALLFRMATAAAYCCEWPTGEDKMLLISVGTGMASRNMVDPNHGGEGLFQTAKTIPSELMRGISVEADITCRTLGRCVAGPAIDSELGDLIPDKDQKTNRHFTYARYDIDVSEDSLTGMGLGDIDSSTLTLENVKAVADMKRIGQKLGTKVDMANQFGAFLQ